MLFFRVCFFLYFIKLSAGNVFFKRLSCQCNGSICITQLLNIEGSCDC